MKTRAGIPAIDRKDRAVILMKRVNGWVTMTAGDYVIGTLQPSVAKRLFGHCPTPNQEMEVEIDFEVTRTVTALITHSR